MRPVSLRFLLVITAALVLVNAALLVPAAWLPGGRRQAAAAPGGGQRPLRVGLVFDVGGRGDKSFNDAAYAGLERAQKELGVHFNTLETSEGADREVQLRQLAAGPSQIIFGVGFLFTDDIRSLAKEFPDKKFACVDFTVNEGDSLPANLLAHASLEKDVVVTGGGNHLKLWDREAWAEKDEDLFATALKALDQLSELPIA